MTSTRTTFSLDADLAEQARSLGINVSAAARDGVASAVKAALVESDRRAYLACPEQADGDWDDAEIWTSG